MLIKLLRMMPKALGAAAMLLLLQTAVNRLTYKNARFVWLLKRNLLWCFVRILPVPTPVGKSNSFNAVFGSENLFDALQMLQSWLVNLK
jgi:hypothetical protein